MDRVNFTQMKDRTKEEYEFLLMRVCRATRSRGWGILSNLPRALGVTGQTLTGSCRQFCMTLKIFSRPIIMTNMQRRS
jgi:hypothetical protein